MKRGDWYKAGYLFALLLLLGTLYLYTRTELADGAQADVLAVDSAAQMGDAPDPAPPTLAYSEIYDEVTSNKRRRPSLNCEAALVVDNKTGKILYGKNEHELRSIASLTKLMTAMVYLDSKPDMTRLVTISKEDAANSAKSQLARGETFVALDLLHAALMSSDNRAARAISRASGLSKAEFVRRMNRKAALLGLKDTRFEEVTGLSQNNVSTAYDCALLLHSALEYRLIKEITTMERFQYYSRNKKRAHRATNSNRLLSSQHKIAGGKTGYIIASGWCLATRGCDSQGRDITAVILGSTSNSQRFRDADRALTWGYNNAG
jgi:D-alanyl-D-alanine endopeptidase (penicillin-binding protein 7)